MGVSTRLVSSVLITVIMIIIVFQVTGDTAHDVGTAADNATSTNLTGSAEQVAPGNVFPLTSFFKKKGVILLAFMAGVALVIIMAVLPGKK